VVNSTIDTPAPILITYSWSAPDFNPTTYEGTTFTSTAPETSGTYSITLTAHRENYCDLGKTKDVDVLDCTAPSSTVNFTAFNPCSNTTTGDYWYLTDTRELNNVQTYKVKLMADGRIWMVQDLKFGNLCGATFAGSSADQTGKVSNIGTYYGDCRNNTQGKAGYLYDWAAAINKASAYYGSSNNVGCSGTGSTANACQGICPDGWHIPTGASSGEFQALHNAIGNCSTGNDDCWDSNSAWEGVLGGDCASGGSFLEQGSYAYYGSSTYHGNIYAYMLRFGSDSTLPDTYGNKHYGRSVRCVRNY
jgi:uncharacterized protein (TIGR02145 family)